MMSISKHVTFRRSVFFLVVIILSVFFSSRPSDSLKGEMLPSPATVKTHLINPPGVTSCD